MSPSARGKAEVQRLQRVLDDTFKRVNNIDHADLELRSDFARYLCVVVAGFVEKSMQELALEWCRKQSGPSVTRYVAHQLQYFQTPRRGAILEFVGRFDSGWRDELEVNFADELEAVSSVMGNRHVIAHGGTLTVSYTWVSEYYERIKKLVARLSRWFDP